MNSVLYKKWNIVQHIALKCIVVYLFHMSIKVSCYLFAFCWTLCTMFSIQPWAATVYPFQPYSEYFSTSYVVYCGINWQRFQHWSRHYHHTVGKGTVNISAGLLQWTQNYGTQYEDHWGNRKFYMMNLFFFLIPNWAFKMTATCQLTLNLNV